MHQVSLAIADHGTGRNMNLQSRDVWMGHHHILLQRRSNPRLVARTDLRHVHGVGQACELTGLKIDTNDELPILTPCSVCGAAIDIKFLVTLGDTGEHEPPYRIGTCLARSDADLDAGKRSAIHQQHLTADAGLSGGHRRYFDGADRQCFGLRSTDTPAGIGTVLSGAPDAFGQGCSAFAERWMVFSATQHRFLPDFCRVG